MRTSLRYRVPPMPFTLSVSEVAALVNTIPGIRSVRDRHELVPRPRRDRGHLVPGNVDRRQPSDQPVARCRLQRVEPGQRSVEPWADHHARRPGCSTRQQRELPWLRRPRRSQFRIGLVQSLLQHRDRRDEHEHAQGPRGRLGRARLSRTGLPTDVKRVLWPQRRADRIRLRGGAGPDSKFQPRTQAASAPGCSTLDHEDHHRRRRRPGQSGA